MSERLGDPPAEAATDDDVDRTGWDQEGGYWEEMVPGTPGLQPQEGDYIHPEETDE